MIAKPTRTFAFLLLPLLISGYSFAELDEDAEQRLTTHVRTAMDEGNIPSLTIALVKGNEIVWSKAFGYSNLWAKTQATTDTVYLIGSTYKAMSTFALLQLVEQRKFELDDPVSPLIDSLKIEGETQPITLRHLMTHTSGIPGGFGPHRVWGDTVPLPLEDFLSSTLKVDRPPRAEYEYSNVAYALIGYLVERHSGMDYRSYIRKNIFTPLAMHDTAFEPSPLMIERLAIPYLYDKVSDSHLPADRLKADAWPAGIVYGTVLNQANWLIANLNGGKFRGNRILKKKTLQEIMTAQYDEPAGIASGDWHTDTAAMGLTWWVVDTDEGKLFSHSGSVPGYTAWITGNLDTKTGVAILTNGYRSHPHLSNIANEALRMLNDEKVK